jgi:2-haloacid dehalogenase
MIRMISSHLAGAGSYCDAGSSCSETKAFRCGPARNEEEAMADRLAGIEACVFDAYGTLFDYASAASRCRDALGDRIDRLTALWRDKQVQYTWWRATHGKHADFWQVTGDALDYAMETLGISDAILRKRLMELYLALDPFPEVPDLLARLKRTGMRMAILSNGTPWMIDALVEHAGLTGIFEALLSVEEVGVFKPHPRVYQLAVDRLGAPARSIAFLSSNGWDAHGASSFGMRVVWCNRYGQKRERLPGTPDCSVTSLAELPLLLGLGI